MLLRFYTVPFLIPLIIGSSERDRTGLAGTNDHTARSAKDFSLLPVFHSKCDTVPCLAAQDFGGLHTSVL